MTDVPPDEELLRWFRAMDLEHPAVRVLWKIALQKRKPKEASTRAP